MKHEHARAATFGGLPMVSVLDLQGRRQAHNLIDRRLRDSLRPWFPHQGNPKVEWALAALDRPEERESGAAFLGIRIIPAGS